MRCLFFEMQEKSVDKFRHPLQVRGLLPPEALLKSRAEVTTEVSLIEVSIRGFFTVRTCGCFIIEELRFTEPSQSLHNHHVDVKTENRISFCREDKHQTEIFHKHKKISLNK